MPRSRSAVSGAFLHYSPVFLVGDQRGCATSKQQQQEEAKGADLVNMSVLKKKKFGRIQLLSSIRKRHSHRVLSLFSAPLHQSHRTCNLLQTVFFVSRQRVSRRCRGPTQSKASALGALLSSHEREGGTDIILKGQHRSYWYSGTGVFLSCVRRGGGSPRKCGSEDPPHPQKKPSFLF